MTTPSQNNPVPTPEGAFGITLAFHQWLAGLGLKVVPIAAATRKNEEQQLEIERLENLTATGIHTCSDTCQRPLCILRRELEAVTRQNEEMSETNKRLNRRCQKAEGIVEASGLVDGRAQGNAGRTLGRALANYAADIYRRERDAAVAQVEQLKSHFAASSRDHEVTQETLTRVLAERDRWEQMYRGARIDVDSHHAMCVRIWSSLGECDPDKTHDLPCDVQLANRLTAALAQVEQLKDRVAELEGGK